MTDRERVTEEVRMAAARYRITTIKQRNGAVRHRMEADNSEARDWSDAAHVIAFVSKDGAQAQIDRTVVFVVCHKMGLSYGVQMEIGKKCRRFGAGFDMVTPILAAYHDMVCDMVVTKMVPK